LLDVLTQDSNYCDDGFIAEIAPFAKLAIAYTQYTIVDSNLGG
jgi:hypothetical protein